MDVYEKYRRFNRRFWKFFGITAAIIGAVTFLMWYLESRNDSGWSDIIVFVFIVCIDMAFLTVCSIVYLIRNGIYLFRLIFCEKKK